ncbi:methyltransferase domain-containing protein [soil metagenome]
MTERDGEANEYVLGTHRVELLRLGFQHQVWAPHTSSLWQRAGFGPGKRLLDLGCGPGYASFDLAHLAGAAGEVLAVDMSQRFVDHLQEQAVCRGISNLRGEVQDVENLKVGADSLDGAFARWVLCFTSDPGSVVAGAARALRPGGRFAVMDYCHYRGLIVAPHSPEIDRVISATFLAVTRRGGNMDVGRDIPAMMRSCGLEVQSVQPIVRAARPGSALWKWPETFFLGYLTTLLEMELITEDEAAGFRRAWTTRSADPSAYLFTPPMVEVIGVKV